MTPRPEQAQVDTLAALRAEWQRMPNTSSPVGVVRFVEKLLAALDAAEMWIGAAQTGEPMYPVAAPAPAPPPGAMTIYTGVQPLAPPAPSGPWNIEVEGDIWMVIHKKLPSSRSFTARSEVEALAVRDALNRVASAPPPEEGT